MRCGRCMRRNSILTNDDRAADASTRLRLGVRAQGFLDWTGGTAFLCGILSGLRDGLPGSEIHLLVEDRGLKSAVVDGINRISDVVNRCRGILRKDETSENLANVARAVDQVSHVSRGASALTRKVSELGLDIIIPSMAPLPSAFEPPWMGYIYDFQHRQLPHLFPPGERRKRDRSFKTIMENADGILVNSRDTARIAAEIYGAQRAKLHAMPFCACPPEAWFQGEDVDPPCGRRVPYVMVCNQFWVHKDHQTAFRALTLLPTRHRDVAMVCTGNTQDYRRPRYFSELMELVESLGVTNRVHVMGLLPKESQISLMRQSAAVIQPTLCEGGPGGGSTYDAVAMGVPAILSDIPINLELRDEREICFFHAQDPEDLAAAMTRILDNPPHRDSRGVLLARGKARWRRYCEALRSAVSQTIASCRRVQRTQR